MMDLEPGFYWVRLGGNPPEIGHLESEHWWLCGSNQPWPAEGVEVLSDRLQVPRPRLTLVPPDESG
jgi:hypothetical protein